MKNILHSKISLLLAFTALLLNVYCKKDSNTGMTVRDASGNEYKTVKIGNQIWMAENLRTKKYRNGDDIQLVTDPDAWKNLNTGAYRAAPDADYGFYYNWYAVMDNRNLAPEGWHVATDADYTELGTFLGGNAVAGGKLKEAGTSHWLTPNTGATNESGFTALPAGIISAEDGSINGYYFGYIGWTSNLYPGTLYPTVYNVAYSEAKLNKVNSFIISGSGTTPARFGCSVRCVKD